MPVVALTRIKMSMWEPLISSGGKTHRVGIYILRYFEVSCILQATRIEPDSYFKRTRSPLVKSETGFDLDSTIAHHSFIQ